MNALRGLTVVAGDVAALETAVDHLSKSGLPRKHLGQHRTQLRRATGPVGGAQIEVGQSAFKQPRQRGLDAVTVPQQGIAVQRMQALQLGVERGVVGAPVVRQPLRNLGCVWLLPRLVDRLAGEGVGRAKLGVVHAGIHGRVFRWTVEVDDIARKPWHEQAGAALHGKGVDRLEMPVGIVHIQGLRGVARLEGCGNFGAHMRQAHQQGAVTAVEGIGGWGGCVLHGSDLLAADEHPTGRIRTQPVTEFVGMMQGPGHKVGALLCGKLAAVVQAERPRAVHGKATQGFFGREAKQGAGHIEHEQRVQGGGRAGVVVGGQRDGHAGLAQRGDGRQAGFAQKVKRAGQQHRHAARARHRGDALRVEVLQMVAGQRAVTGCQRRPALVAELFRMQLDRQAEGAGGVEHPPGLRRGEGDALAERIHRVHQSFSLELGQPSADGIDVVVRAALELGRQGVRGKAGGAHSQWQFLTDLARGSKTAGFVLQAQAVAGLDFHRGHPSVHEGASPLARGGQKLCITGGAGRPHRRPNATTGAGDVFVARPVKPLLELVSALAAVNQMGMTIDQARRDQVAAQIVRARCNHIAWQFRLGSHPAKHVALGEQRSLVDQTPSVCAIEGAKPGIAIEGQHDAVGSV